jgi:hypothetical protein
MRHGSEAFRRPMLLSLAAKKFIALSFICEKLVKHSFTKQARNRSPRSGSCGWHSTERVIQLRTGQFLFVREIET